jgi:hypothetical protein
MSLRSVTSSARR